MYEICTQRKQHSISQFGRESKPNATVTREPLLERGCVSWTDSRNFPRSVLHCEGKPRIPRFGGLAGITHGNDFSLWVAVSHNILFPAVISHRMSELIENHIQS